MSEATSLQVNPPRLDPVRLQQVAASVYQSIGVPQSDAALAADTLVQADLWGHQSHGLLRLGWYYARLKSGAMKAVTHTSLPNDAGAICVMDGHDGIGQVITRQAVDQAVTRAKLHGVGVVSIRNSNHFGTCMYYTRIAAEQGLQGGNFLGRGRGGDDHRFVAQLVRGPRKRLLRQRRGIRRGKRIEVQHRHMQARDPKLHQRRAGA